MLKIFQRLWQVNWAEQWQYRANLLMYLLYWLVSPIIYLAVWTSIANSKGSVNGLTANDFINILHDAPDRRSDHEQYRHPHLCL